MANRPYLSFTLNLDHMISPLLLPIQSILFRKFTKFRMSDIEFIAAVNFKISTEFAEYFPCRIYYLNLALDWTPIRTYTITVPAIKSLSSSLVRQSFITTFT